MKKTNLWERATLVRSNIGTELIESFGVNGVSVGSEKLRITLPSGSGDAISHIALKNSGEWDSSFLNYLMSFEGELNIFASDVDDEILKTLDYACYNIYYGYGFVVFEKT